MLNRVLDWIYVVAKMDTYFLRKIVEMRLLTSEIRRSFGIFMSILPSVSPPARPSLTCSIQSVYSFVSSISSTNVLDCVI